jgi:hypothetical protein
MATEEIVQKDAFGIEGLWYIPKFISANDLVKIKEMIQDDINFEPISKSANSRKVAHFCYYYSYDRTGLKPDHLKSM